MKEEHQRLDLWQEPAKIGIDEERKCHHSVEQKRSVPSLVVVARMIQYQKTLHQSPGYVSSTCDQGLPCNDCQPSCEVAKEFSA